MAQIVGKLFDISMEIVSVLLKGLFRSVHETSQRLTILDVAFTKKQPWQEKRRHRGIEHVAVVLSEGWRPLAAPRAPTTMASNFQSN